MLPATVKEEPPESYCEETPAAAPAVQKATDNFNESHTPVDEGSKIAPENPNETETTESAPDADPTTGVEHQDVDKNDDAEDIIDSKEEIGDTEEAPEDWDSALFNKDVSICIY